VKSLSVIVLILAAALGFSGCSRSVAETRSPEMIPAAIYKANRGLKFSPTATQLFGVKTGDVSSHDVGASKGVAAIPADALLRTIKGDFVYVANGGWFLRTPVTIGTHDRDWCEVKEGLYEGDAIVVRGARILWLAELQAINGGADDDGN